MKVKRRSKEILWIALWLVTTLSLATWWVIFNFRQVEELKRFRLLELSVYIRKQHMLVYEGLFLFGLLILGGVGLYTLLFRERKLNETIRQFFATFTHEMKTSLASLRLQAESLQEEVVEGSEASTLSQRLVKDSLRIEIQLENSLFLAQMDQGQLFYESIVISKLLKPLLYSFPELNVKIHNDADIHADRRVMDCIFKNLLQNALVHGKARSINLNISPAGKDRVEIKVCDDGRGFEGDREKLGQIFYRHRSNSGSGIGLFIVRTMCELLKGRAYFGQQLQDDEKPAIHGFCVSLHLPGKFLVTENLDSSKAVGTPK